MEHHIEQLDKVGCDYGRVTRENFMHLCKEIELLKLQKNTLSNDLKNLREQITMLANDLSSLKTRFAWLIGALTIAGSLVGQALGMIAKIAFGAH